MAINFPDSPTNGQVFTSGSTSWIYNSTKAVWKILSSTSSTVIISQSFTGNGSNTQFTVTGGYTIGTLAIYVNGVKAVNSIDVTQADGSTINFTTAPLNSSIIEVYGYAPAPDITVSFLPLAGGIVSGPTTFNSNITINGTITATNIFDPAVGGTISGPTIFNNTATFNNSFNTNGFITATNIFDPIIVDDISNQFNGTTAVFNLLQNQVSINTITDSKDIEVIIDGQRLAPYMVETRWPWYTPYDSFKGYRVINRSTGVQLIIYNPPYLMDSASIIVRTKSASIQQKNKYPFTAIAIALGD